MPEPAHLVARLDAIAAALQRRPAALALLGLGSAGRERDRLDGCSDLDFFAVVAPGHKAAFVDDLGWLAEAHPLAWSFRNTADGHKVLMADGVFCEFAVFEPQELAAIPYAPGRVVWRREGFDAPIEVPARPLPPPRVDDRGWIVGEALSCVLVGLLRWHRGERLSAARFVQGHAVDRLVELDRLVSPADPAAPAADAFDPTRRVERRQPDLAAELPGLVPGYDATPAAALAVLQALRRRGEDPWGPAHAAVTARIEALAGHGR